MARSMVLLVLAWSLAAPVPALQLADVEVPETVPAPGGERLLVLNGAGIRKKFFISVYVAALYLPQAQRDAQALLASPPASRLTMTFVYPKVKKAQMDEGWWEGFERNLPAGGLEPLRERVTTFVGLFDDMLAGDTVVFDYRPGEGTTVTVNGQWLGQIPGADFHAALLSVWLGPDPVTEELKKGLLGVDK